MNPDLKLLLDEMDKRFSVQERRFDTIERKLDTSSAASASRLDALESATKGFDEWRPSIEGVVDDLKLEVHKLATLKLEVGKITKYWERSMVDAPSATPGVFAPTPPLKSASAPSSPSAAILDTKPVLSPNFKSAFTTDCQDAGRASAGIPAEPPLGTRVEHRTREGEFGVVTTLIPPPGIWTIS
jgi:hypothetical protein